MNVGYQPYFSTRSGATWSGANTLTGKTHASSAASSRQSMAIAINDNNVTLLAWYQFYGQGKKGIFARTNRGGAWGEPTYLGDGSYLDVGTNGHSFMVAWADSTDRLLKASLYEGGKWSNLGAIDDVTSSDGDITVQSNGSGYAVAWIQRQSEDDVFVNLYNGTAWQGAASLTTTAGASYDPALASNGSGYCLIWSQFDSGDGAENIYARIYDGAAWSAVDTLDVGTDYTYWPAVASDGTGYMAVWTQFLPSKDSESTYAASYTGTAWQVAQRLDAAAHDAYGPVVASDGSSYVTIWQQRDSDLLPYDLVSRLHNGTDWQAEADVETGDDDAGGAAIATDGDSYGVLWAQGANGSTEPFAALFDGTGWQVDGPFSSADGSSSTATMVANGSGFVAAWSGYNGVDKVMEIWTKVGF